MRVIPERCPDDAVSWRAVLWLGIVALLAIPLVAMRFTNEVRWNAPDFAAAAALMAGFGIAVELACRLASRPNTRALAIGAAAGTMLLLWAEAAVGIF